MITSNLEAPGVCASKSSSSKSSSSKSSAPKSSASQSSSSSSANSDASPSKRRATLRQELVFIDGTVPHYSILATGVHPGVEVIMLDSNRDGIEQITHVLRKRKGLSSLHIISPGTPSHLHLGSGVLNLNTLERYVWDLAIWGTAFIADAELLVYGSEIAKGVRGEELIAHLSELIGVKVAASRTKTGSVAAGGNWDLEINTGHCITPPVFSPEAMASYDKLL
jgi:hypothetical protein